MELCEVKKFVHAAVRSGIVWKYDPTLYDMVWWDIEPQIYEAVCLAVCMAIRGGSDA